MSSLSERIPDIKKSAWPSDHIMRRKVRELIPYARNSRLHSKEQIAQIASSILEWGFTNPILIGEDDVVIAGHGRIEAAEMLGLDDVPCMVARGWSDAQKRAYIIADNKLAENASWDLDALGSEFKVLLDEGFAVEKTGFGLDQIAGMTAEEAAPDAADDELPELSEDAVSALGDLWLLGNHRLLCGDATVITDVERLMDGARADMIFTDPPYGVDYKGINNDSREGLFALLDQSFSNYALAANPGASIYVFHSDRCADIFHEVFRRYCHFSSMIIWVKPSLILGQSDYHSRHEPCMYGWIEGAKHNWYSDRKQDSIWEYGKEKVEGHTTPKPVEMVMRAIKASSQTNHVVMDLFGGSGSTLIACEKLNRHGRVMELDPKYIDVIIKRWEKISGAQAKLEDGRTFAEVENGKRNTSTTDTSAA